MIRLIQRRLIIPRGDTGSFSIPTLGSVEPNDIAIFSIFDPLTHKTVVMKIVAATQEFLTIPIISEDTIKLEPRKYNWDISIYKSPIYDEEGELIGAAEINSYYSAFKLPICEITEVAYSMDKDRWKTRDLIVNYNNFPSPFSTIKSVYPWENMPLSILSRQIYEIAKKAGYLDDENSFWTKFSSGSVVATTLEDFPLVGEYSKVYLDKSTGTLYYFTTNKEISEEMAIAVGAKIVGNAEINNEEVVCLYIPIRAMPLENLILSAGTPFDDI